VSRRERQGWARRAKDLKTKDDRWIPAQLCFPRTTVAGLMMASKAVGKWRSEDELHEMRNVSMQEVELMQMWK
jgi:hypothetical protein